MGLVSSGRYNSAVTNGQHPLVAAVAIRRIGDVAEADRCRPPAAYDGPGNDNFEVVGQCGHRLAVVPSGWQVENWQQRIENQTRHRKRCLDCTRDSR